MAKYASRKITETGNATIGGTRETWVSKGVDHDPSIAKLENGLLSYKLDNDECYGGLVYSNFDTLDLFNYEIAFDILYNINDHMELASASATVSLLDSNGNSGDWSISLGTGNAERATGTYTMGIDDQQGGLLDLTMIDQIDICFGGNIDYYDWFSIDSIYAIQKTGSPNTPVPEPTTMLLFGIGLAGLAGTFRRKKN